jgi:FMN-dependent NADH-azoreductase
MSKLLYVEASPLKSRSHTIAVAQAFLQTYRAINPADDIEQLDLWQTPLPPFDAQTIEAKFAILRNNPFSPEQWERWEAVRKISRHFNSADKYVFSVPMWNFGVPYVFKHYVDVVTLPNENWTWSRNAGYGALLSGKKALAIYASANLHAESGPDADDFQKPFIRRWLRFVGVEAVQEVTLAPTLSSPEAFAELRAAAIGEVTRIAQQF